MSENRRGMQSVKANQDASRRVFFWEILSSEESLLRYLAAAESRGDWNALQFREAVEILPRTPCYAPEAIQLEPTTRCNLSCNYCPRSSSTIDARDLTIHELESVLSSFPHLKRIHLQGKGEPFLHPALRILLERLERANILVSTITNGSVLPESLLEALRQGLITDVAISVDSLNPETVAVHRLGLKLEMLRNTLRTLANLDDINLSIACVATMQTLPDLAGLVRGVHRYGIREVFVQEVQACFAPNGCLLESPSKVDAESAEEWYAQAKRAAEELGVSLGIQRYDSKRRVRRSCVWPWTSCYITVQGEVCPCCVNTAYSCGNIYSQPWEDIWHGEKYQAFRKALSEGPIDRTCSQCIYL